MLIILKQFQQFKIDLTKNGINKKWAIYLGNISVGFFLFKKKKI